MDNSTWASTFVVAPDFAAANPFAAQKRDEAPQITVIGTGYLGATHAVCMAEMGFNVLGLDVSDDHCASRPTSLRQQPSETSIFSAWGRHKRRVASRLTWPTSIRR